MHVRISSVELFPKHKPSSKGCRSYVVEIVDKGQVSNLRPEFRSVGSIGQIQWCSGSTKSTMYDARRLLSVRRKINNGSCEGNTE